MRTRPVSVLGVSSAVSLGPGRDHGVAVIADGRVMTWGHNVSGQLGDGTTSNSTRAVFVPGVTGAAKSGGGGSEYSVILVGTGPQPNQDPVARATFGCTGMQCTFSGAGSTDADGEITGYAWDFGDLSGDDGVSVSHSDASPGTYDVTLTVTDDGGQWVATSSRSQSTRHRRQPSPSGQRRPRTTTPFNLVSPCPPRRRPATSSC